MLGPDDFRVAMALTNLGLACLDAGQPDRAVLAQTRARTIFLNRLGPTHAHTLLAGRRLAVALAAADHPARARELITEALQAAAARTGDSDAERGGSQPTPRPSTARPATTSWPNAGSSRRATRWLRPSGPSIPRYWPCPPWAGDAGLQGPCKGAGPGLLTFSSTRSAPGESSCLLLRSARIGSDRRPA